jgi:NAD(P)-dependent dehydrogenase (short-subunit alcohol dehydrogenase family)
MVSQAQSDAGAGRLQGKVAVVTGGTTGIGAAITGRLAREGAHVTFGGRREAPGAELAEKLTAKGLDVAFVSCDVSEEAGAEKLVAAAASGRGRVDVVVLNAGIVYPGHGKFWEVAPEDFDTVMRVNVGGAFLTARAAVPHMREGGSIVAIASMASLVILPNESVYSTSKGAMLQLVRGMAVDLAERGVRVNAVCPGFTDAGQTHEVLEASDDAAKLLDSFNSAPLGRMGTAEEMAGAVAFFASDDSTFCTGASLVADGGFTLI